MGNILTVFRFGWPYLRRYRTRLACVFVFSIVFALSNGGLIGATRTLISRFSKAPSEKALAEKTSLEKKMPARFSGLAQRAETLNKSFQQTVEKWLPRVGQPVSLRQSFGIVLFLTLLVGIRAGADYLSNYCMGWVSERVIRDVRLDIMEKLSTLSLDFFTRSTTGDLLTRLNTDSQNLLRSLRQGAADLIKESISLVSILVILLILDWRLTLWTMILVPVCMFPLIVLGKKTRRATGASRKASIMQSSQLVELLGSIRIIKAFNLETEEIARFRKSSDKMVSAGMKGVQAKELVNPLIGVIGMIGFGGVLLYVFKSGRSGEDLAAFLTGILLFFLSIKKLAGIHILFEQANIGTMRLIDILNEKPKVVEPLNPKPFREFRSEITFEDVSFGYNDKQVVRDFTLKIPQGFRLGLAGESGSGKTTLVNLLFRFYDPTRGAIKIDGLDLREISLHALRQQLALVSQDVVLFDQTVAENIACGKIGASREEVETAAKAAFAHEFIMQMPQGYDTRVGERGVTLSGGQRQRVAIARAFVRNAPILVLDEATASLDSKSEGEVQTAIDRLAEHRTVICVAHRLSTLASMSHILVLSEGRIIESGSFEELLKMKGPFAAMAARQGIFLTPVR